MPAFITALHCPSSMEYDACRKGCVEDCGSIQALPGDWLVARGNESSCIDTPTEGCFCTGGTVLHHGQCVSPETCSQCADQHGRTYKVTHMVTHVCICIFERSKTLTNLFQQHIINGRNGWRALHYCSGVRAPSRVHFKYTVTGHTNIVFAVYAELGTR